MDLKFNFTGGGDSDFIDRSAKGFTIAWCSEASCGDYSGFGGWKRLDHGAGPAQRRPVN